MLQIRGKDPILADKWHDLTISGDIAFVDLLNATVKRWEASASVTIRNSPSFLFVACGRLRQSQWLWSCSQASGQISTVVNI